VESDERELSEVSSGAAFFSGDGGFRIDSEAERRNGFVKSRWLYHAFAGRVQPKKMIYCAGLASVLSKKFRKEDSWLRQTL
jgi:hypothetical protein